MSIIHVVIALRINLILNVCNYLPIQKSDRQFMMGNSFADAIKVVKFDGSN
jgi:hypothetical protein